jgi:16S rRNA (guanine527-N7)-methyltransferase
MTKHGGEIIALKGEKAQLEIDDSKRLMKKLDIESFEIVFTGAHFLDEPTRVVRTKLV